MKKTLVSLFILVFLISFISPSAQAVVGIGDDFYVNDTANVLSNETKAMIDSYNGDLEYYCKGAQLVVVTVEYLDGMYCDEYAGALFENYGVGSAQYNNGMLLLLATGENKAWLTVGKGICDDFTDDMVDEYFNEYFWKKFDSGDFDGAVYDMVYNLAWWFADYYEVSERADGSTAQSESVLPGSSVSSTLGKLAGLGIIGSLLYFLLSLIGNILGFVFNHFFTIMIIVIIIINIIKADRMRWNAYYRHMGVPIPIYRPWFIFTSRPYRSWHDPNDRGPRGPGGFGGGGGFWGGSGGGFGGGGSSSGGFGGHSGGFGGGGHSGGGFGGGGGMGGGGGRR